MVIQPTTTMDQQALEKLQEIFRVVLELPDGADVSAANRDGWERWDSLAHVSLIAAIESEFGVSLDSKDPDRITSYEAARSVLTERGL